MIDIGHCNYVAKNKIVAITVMASDPIRRAAAAKLQQCCLVDATCGRRTQSVIVTSNGDYILSSLSTKTLVKRYIEEG